MELPVERTLGGTGQDVTIVLVPEGGSADQKLAVIHLHSHVLSTHSNYFNTCLNERWRKQASPSASIAFVQEVQTNVEYYFDCFSSMYSPFVKNFRGVEHGLELLKVASQIDFPKLMERISLYLSTMSWSLEDEFRVREYSISPDFPRIHLKDLVVRLGLDESEEDRRKQLYNLVRQCICATFKPSIDQAVVLPAFLKGIGRGQPSDFYRMVITIVSQQAKDIFANIGIYQNEYVLDTASRGEVKAACCILEALLDEQVAEELVEGIVHLDVIPSFVSKMTDCSPLAIKQKFASLVRLMYEQVAAGQLQLRSTERIALLANWHVVMKTSLKVGSFEHATKKLFRTLPLKDQTEFINLRKENVYDYIHKIPLISLLPFHGGLGLARELDSDDLESETIVPVIGI